MEYKYNGRTYQLRLNDKGNVECLDENITAATVEEVKQLIREANAKEKAAPRIKVLVLELPRWGEASLYECTTSGKSSGSFFGVLVSWKDEKGKPQREKKRLEDVYLDTPENRKVAFEIIALHNQIHKLEKQKNNLDDKLETLEDKQ